MKRFWDKVKKTETCWLWMASKDGSGYGEFFLRKVKGKMLRARAHRISWELHNGAIPEGLHVLHECDTPTCVNPDHLFLGTHQENMQDSARKGRARHQTFCGIDHPNAKLSEDNVREIRRRTDVPLNFLARAFMVHRKHIYHLQRGLFWKHLTS